MPGTQPSARRYQIDNSVQHFGRVVVGGSPLKLFRLSSAGEATFERLAAGERAADSTLVTRLLDAGAIHPVAEAGPFDVSDVTIVVPTLGVPERVPKGALIVDDGSPTPVPGAAIRLEANRGAGAARNAGLARVTTPLVAFVDDDVELPDGWLDPLLAHFVDPRLALVAPRVRSPGSDSTLARYEHASSPLDLGPEPARIRAGTRVSYVPAAAIVCRVDALREVGGFDESLRFGEDVDLVWRLDLAGWRCRYEPGSEVRHRPRSTWGGWVRQRIGYGSSTASLARRHPGALAPIRMSGWSIGAWLLAALGRPIAGSLVGCRLGGCARPQAARRARQGRVRPRRHGQPARRRSDRQRHPTRVVAAAGDRRRQVTDVTSDPVGCGVGGAQPDPPRRRPCLLARSLEGDRRRTHARPARTGDQFVARTPVDVRS